MRVKGSDVFAILSLFSIGFIFGEEHQNGKQESEQQKRDPMKLVKDSQ